MGWERKRGKIEEFNRLLRGATETSFDTYVGDVSVLATVRYCITLDSDTRLPRDTARELLGIITHPLNRAAFDPRAGRVTDGYGILQPRVSVTYASAAGSLFARLFAGHTGVDPYTTAVSDTYQDLFGEGIFTGKGLYDVDAFTTALEDCVPENALLSHDLFEGLHARVALVSDVELVDEYPSSVLAHVRRQHRWIRGDWQILFWLFPFVPSRHGMKRNTLPLIGRWKILDNLRRSLVAPTLLAMLMAAWTILPGPLGFWLATVLTVIASQLLPLVGRLLVGPAKAQSFAVFARNLREDTITALGQVALGLTFLANNSWETIHAIVLTLIRPGRHTAAPAGVGDCRGNRGTVGGADRPEGRAPLCRRDDGKPDHRDRRRRPDPGDAPGSHPVGRAVPAPVVVSAGGGVLAQPARRPAAASARGQRAYLRAAHGSKDVALLRDICHRRGRLAASRQLPGRRRRSGAARAAHVADQHRDVPALDRGGPRSRVHLDRVVRDADRSDADHARRAGASRGALPQLVRHEHACADAPALRVDRRQRQRSGRADRTGAVAGGRRRTPAAGRSASFRSGRHRGSADARLRAEPRGCNRPAPGGRREPARQACGRSGAAPAGRRRPREAGRNRPSPVRCRSSG
jgi:hypothetical protein